MAEYYKWVNVDKKEYLSPWNFDLGNRRTESLSRGSEVLRSLRELLSSRWKEDRILFLGDECRLSGEEGDLLGQLYEHTVMAGCPGDVAELVSEHYKNVSAQFKAAEKVTRADIRLFLEEAESESFFQPPNEYGLDLKDPYAGLFLLSGLDCPYILNHTKAVGYALERVQVRCPDGTAAPDGDPLPLLMSFGREAGPGPWLGDIIGVSEEIPEGFEQMDEVFIP